MDRNRILMIALCIAPLSGLAAGTAEPTLKGTWEGVVTRNDRSWSIRLSAWDTPSGVRGCFDFPDYGLYYRCTSNVTDTDAGAHVRYVSGRDVVTLDGTLTSTVYRGRWTGLGVEAEFRLERTGLVAEPLVEEDIRFQNGNVDLAGTFIRPPAKRRYAAVVWTHGSGNQRRSEDFYRDRGYLLAEHGVAALIYDKRGVGDSGGDAESTLDELAGDAVAAVQFLQARDDVSRNNVGVGGFSQGGFVAPLASARYGRIAFVVTGATPGVTPAELNDFAAQSALVRRGFPVDVIERAMDLRHQVQRVQEGIDPTSELDRKLEPSRKEAWYTVAGLPATAVRPYGRRGLSVLHFDPRLAWEHVHVPAFAVWGGDDQLVPVERSRQLIQTWLHVAGNRDVSTFVFPGAGHGLAVAGRPGVWDWPRLAPGFHEMMVKWIIARVSP